MKLRVFTAFSGYDSQCMALQRVAENHPDFHFDLVGWSEIDPNAIKAHNAVFPQWKDRNYGDIAKIDWNEVPDFDLFTYSSPCQDFSLAGVQRGGQEGSGTRSSLLWECRKAILAKRPKFMILENVDNLVSKKFIHTFREWERELASYGYWNYWKCLNAKHYGVPQNRNRVFLVSFLKEQRFDFPKPIKLERRLKDVLETTVSERYYLPDDAVAQMLDNASGSALLTAPKGRVSVVGKLSSSQNSRVIDTEEISPALINGNKGGMPKILVECQDEFLKAGGGTMIAPLNANPDGVCRTIKAQYGKNSLNNFTRTDGFGATAVIEIDLENEN